VILNQLGGWGGGGVRSRRTRSKEEAGCRNRGFMSETRFVQKELEDWRYGSFEKKIPVNLEKPGVPEPGGGGGGCQKLELVIERIHKENKPKKEGMKCNEFVGGAGQPPDRTRALYLFQQKAKGDRNHRKGGREWLWGSDQY